MSTSSRFRSSTRICVLCKPPAARVASSGPTSTRQRVQRRAVDAVGGPLVQRQGAERAVERDRGRVPVEDGELEPGAATLARERGEPADERPAEAPAPMRFVDEEVLQVE